MGRIDRKYIWGRSYLKILIIHPEGNIRNNPNLYYISYFLAKNGYKLDILSERYVYKYQIKTNFFKLYLLKKLPIPNFNNKKNKLLYNLFFLLLKNVGRRYDLIIGVDHKGIIFGDLMSKASKTPLAYINYEIFFKKEVGEVFKRPEIEACQNILFAVCQDNLRAKKLSEENKIPMEKFFLMPVAGTGMIDSPLVNHSLKDKLGIESGKKIALYMGSVEKWTGIQKILDDIENWPDDWILILHGRYDIPAQYKFVEKLPEASRKKIYISSKPFNTFTELYHLPLLADVGIAFYFPDWKSPYTGNNLKYLGWASGKVSTYLQCGLPLIVNEIGSISDAVKDYDLGFVIKEKTNISNILNEVESRIIAQKRKNCTDFFNNHLDLTNHMGSIIELIRNLPKTKKTFFIPIGLFTFMVNCFKLISR